MALCTITGFVYMPNGQPAADRLFKFKPSRKGIVADYFGAVVPEVIEATTNELGFLTVQLLTGNYVAFSALYNGPVVVPDAEEASLYEVFGGTGSVTPPDIAPNFTVLPSLLGSTSLGGTITVDLGAASGVPAPVITGMLTRPGASPVAVIQGQQITVQAGDQGGSMSLTATATNAAGVDTETVSRAIPAAIPAPVFTTPLADVVLTVGDADVVVNLDDNTDNATSYSVSPTGGAVTISGSIMTTSSGAEVDQIYVVTAAGPGGTATDSFGVLVEAAPVNVINAVVVIGASHEFAMFGKDLATPNAEATSMLAAAGHSLPVYGWATGGARLNRADDHYTAARNAFPNALIVSQFGGNNVSDTRPYPGGQTTFNTGLSELLGVASGDTRFYPASLTFRDYDDTTFITPANGSKPYNENLLLPWITTNFPHAMAPYGRPKLDLYRFVLSDFENLLEADNIHFTPTGYAALKDYYIDRIADILSGTVPAEIAERVYVAPPVTTPSQVATPAATGTGNSRTITWTAPADNGSPITDYVVRVGGSIVSDGVSTGTSYEMTGLSDGSYSVTVAAVNANGAGPQSSAVTFNISTAAPSYPALTTAGGTAGYTTGQFGQAMNSNGSFYARAANSLTPLTSAWGMEAWVRIPTVSRSNIFMGEAGSAVYGVVRASGSSPAGQACITYTGANAATIQLTGGPRIDNNAWHHVAVQFRADGADLFVDGVLVASSAVAISATRPRDGAGTANDSRFTVGHYASTTAFIWSGQVDEVRIWDGLALTAAFTPRTAAYTTLPAGTVAYWALDGNLTGGVPT